MDASFQYHNSGPESTIFLVEATPATTSNYGSTPLLSRPRGYKVRLKLEADRLLKMSNFIGQLLLVISKVIVIGVIDYFDIIDYLGVIDYFRVIDYFGIIDYFEVIDYF